MRTLDKNKISLIKDYINDYYSLNGVSPILEDISDGTGIPVTTVHRYITYMKKADMLQVDIHKKIRTPEMQEEDGETISVPIVGDISCGSLAFAEENIDEYVKLSAALLGVGDYFILRTFGDSMIDAGIDSGDLVVVRKQNYADRGQIIVALCEDEATLKRFYPEPENRRIRLHPENSSLSDIYVDNCIIQGVAVKVIKNLK